MTAIEETPAPEAEEPTAPAPEAEEPAEPAGRRAQRLRAQEAVARAEAAEARLAAALRRDAERLAGAFLAQPGDVFSADLGGVDLADLLDEDGVVDPELVREAAEAIAARRPGLAAARPPHRGEQYDAGARAPIPRRATWGSLLSGRR